MSIRIFVLSGLLALSCAGYESAAASDDSNAQAEKATASAQAITDAKAYLAGIDHTLELAGKGEYGRLKRGSERRLQAARERIADLLNGHASTSELRPDDQFALVNAEETIKSIVQNEDKSRVVCRFQASTGSRIAAKECMTVAEREERARQARLLVRDSQQAHWDGLSQ